jgi:hypothetical protein
MFKKNTVTKYQYLKSLVYRLTISTLLIPTLFVSLGQTRAVFGAAPASPVSLQTGQQVPPPPAPPTNAPSAATKLFLPMIATDRVVPPAEAPVRAMRLDFSNYAASRSQIDQMEQKFKAAGINMVGLGAGRVEWTFFKWPGHQTQWSNDVKDTGVDFLAEDTARFGKWAHVDAVVDVFAPNYISQHPEKAAINYLGQASPNLVSTTELVQGEFGQMLLDMIEGIAANYPVQSISITELDYHSDGYGADDKASYLNYSGRADWPRLSNGLINIHDPSIGNWRTHMLDVYLDKAVVIAHRYGKEFFLDVQLSDDSKDPLTNLHGTNYNIVLQHTDRLVVWGYFGLDGTDPQEFFNYAQFLLTFGVKHMILSFGLWDATEPAITCDELRAAIEASEAGGMANIWVTPSTMMTDAHWQELDQIWGQATGLLRK